MLRDIEEFFEKIKEVRENKEFKKTKELLELVDTIDEIMKKYHDIIKPKQKIYVSDRTSELPEGFGEYGYINGHHVDYYHKHVWVKKNEHTGGTDFQCATCGAWKTVNWSNANDTTASWFDIEYFYNDKALGC